MIEELFNTPYFYFSHTLDLTNCQQKLDGLIENDAKGYFVLGTATPAFTWNYFMLRSGMQEGQVFNSVSQVIEFLLWGVKQLEFRLKLNIIQGSYCIF